MIKKINRKIFVGLAITLIGFILKFIAASMEYVDATGRLHESMATPISALLIVIGIFMLAVGMFSTLLAFIKK